MRHLSDTAGFAATATPAGRRLGRQRLTSLTLMLAVVVGLTLAPAVASARNLQRRLQAAIVPSIELKDATVDDVIAYLRRQSAALDPDGRAVNFLLVVPPGRGDELRARTVTMNLTNIPLMEVIRYFCLAAGLQYRLDDEVVVLADNPQAAPRALETRAYPLAPGVLDATPTRPSPSESRTTW